MSEMTYAEIAEELAGAKAERDRLAAFIQGLRDRALAERAMLRIGADPGPFAGAVSALAQQEEMLATFERVVEELDIGERLILLRDLDRVSIAPLERKLDQATRELEAFPAYHEWDRLYHEQRAHTLRGEQVAVWSQFLGLKSVAINFANQLGIFSQNCNAVIAGLPAGMRQIVTSAEWKRATRPSAVETKRKTTKAA